MGRPNYEFYTWFGFVKLLELLFFSFFPSTYGKFKQHRMKEKPESTENNSLKHSKGLDPQVVRIAWTLRQRSLTSDGHLLDTDTPWTRKSELWGHSHKCSGHLQNKLGVLTK